MNLVLAKVGEKDGLPIYSPMDADDLKACDGRNTLVVDIKGERAKRTILQNKAIHKYCSLLADKFNDAGLDMMTVLKEKSVPVSWTMSSVKDVIWRPIQVAMFQTESTTKLETDQVSRVYKQIARHLSTNLQIDQSFPNKHGD